MPFVSRIVVLMTEETLNVMTRSRVKLRNLLAVAWSPIQMVGHTYTQTYILKHFDDEVPDQIHKTFKKNSVLYVLFFVGVLFNLVSYSLCAFFCFLNHFKSAYDLVAGYNNLTVFWGLVLLFSITHNYCPLCSPQVGLFVIIRNCGLCQSYYSYLK